MLGTRKHFGGEWVSLVSVSFDLLFKSITCCWDSQIKEAPAPKNTRWTDRPTNQPTIQSTDRATDPPTNPPTNQPTHQPSEQPNNRTTKQPTVFSQRYVPRWNNFPSAFFLFWHKRDRRAERTTSLAWTASRPCPCRRCPACYGTSMCCTSSTCWRPASRRRAGRFCRGRRLCEGDASLSAVLTTCAEREDVLQRRERQAWKATQRETNDGKTLHSLTLAYLLHACGNSHEVAHFSVSIWAFAEVAQCFAAAPRPCLVPALC